MVRGLLQYSVYASTHQKVQSSNGDIKEVFDRCAPEEVDVAVARCIGEGKLDSPRARVVAVKAYSRQWWR